MGKLNVGFASCTLDLRGFKYCSLASTFNALKSRKQKIQLSVHYTRWKLGIDQSAKFLKLHQQQNWFCCWSLYCKRWEPRTDCGQLQEEHHHHLCRHLTPPVIVVALFYEKLFLAQSTQQQNWVTSQSLNKKLVVCVSTKEPKGHINQISID